MLLVEYLFKENYKFDNIDVKKEFTKFTKNKFILSDKEISYIKSKIFGNFKNLSLLECVKKISDPIYNLEIYSSDIKYPFNNSKTNKIEERSECIIIFGIKERLELLKRKDMKEFFIDITFKIIPKCYHPYKLMSIASLLPNENKTIIIGFVLLKYMDAISYKKIFQYLYENLGFDPLIVHTDYEISLAIALNECKFFTNKIIHIRCLFHFMQAIRAKCIKYGLCKKKYLRIFSLFLKKLK